MRARLIPGLRLDPSPRPAVEAHVSPFHQAFDRLPVAAATELALKDHSSSADTFRRSQAWVGQRMCSLGSRRQEEGSL